MGTELIAQAFLVLLMVGGLIGRFLIAEAVWAYISEGK
jgi:hypothetical protein